MRKSFLESLVVLSSRGLLILSVLVSATGGFLSLSAQEQPAKTVDRWEPFRFLVGEWVGEGDGQPGQGSGGSTFTLDLNEKILTRKSYNNIPATKDRPAVNHEDLVITYIDPQKQVRAIYWDNEGNTINYAVEVGADKRTITLLSDVQLSAPRFRFTYNKVAADTLKVQFEMAPPGKPEAFTTYVTGTMHRK